MKIYRGGCNSKLFSKNTKILAAQAKQRFLFRSRHRHTEIGCPENAKSLKSQAPQGFYGCLDIDNDEMNKKKFLSASPRVN